MSMDDELRKKLAAWKVRPEIPPDFQRGVWNRIAARETRPSKSHFLAAWAVRLVSMPGLAATVIVLSASIGASLGLIESAHANSQNWKTLEAKYVQSIDPNEQLRSH
ncbi:MAG TPA: hypothetical protein VHS80_17550 [Chthoniobacterales bacterium]|nr:hypothetical protein [Chthoniobacterales bacterium]